MNEIPLTTFEKEMAEIKCFLSQRDYYSGKTEAETDQDDYKPKRWYDHRMYAPPRSRQLSKEERNRFIDGIIGKFELPEIE